MFIASVLETALPVGRASSRFHLLFSLLFCPASCQEKESFAFHHPSFCCSTSPPLHHPCDLRTLGCPLSEALWTLARGSASQDYTLSAEKGHAACAGLCAGCHGYTWRWMRSVRVLPSIHISNARRRGWGGSPAKSNQNNCKFPVTGSAYVCIC